MSVSTLAEKLRNRVAVIQHTELQRGESEARATLMQSTNVPHGNANAPHGNVQTQNVAHAQTPMPVAQTVAENVRNEVAASVQQDNLLGALRVDAAKQKTSSQSRMATVFAQRKAQLAKTNPAQLQRKRNTLKT